MRSTIHKAKVVDTEEHSTEEMQMLNVLHVNFSIVNRVSVVLVVLGTCAMWLLYVLFKYISHGYIRHMVLDILPLCKKYYVSAVIELWLAG